MLIYEARLLQRIDKKIKLAGPDECWNWQAATSEDGYPIVWAYGKHRKVSRLIMKIRFGKDLAREDLICHSCDNPLCCNPKHWFIGTDGDNSRDKKAKGRSNRGTKHGHAKLADWMIPRIKKLVSEKKLTQVQIASLFDVKQSQISFVSRGKTWSHIQ